MFLSCLLLKLRWQGKRPIHLIILYTSNSVRDLIELFCQKPILCTNLTNTAYNIKGSCAKNTHNLTNNPEVLTVLYTAETVGVKIRSSRGCCTGPLGILEERVKDKRTRKWTALAVRANYNHKILSMTQAL